MTDHPALFRPEMVRALLEGRKTQTRRPAWRQARRGITLPFGEQAKAMFSTHWQRLKPGDLIWVRENWRVGRGYDGVKPGHLPVVDVTKPIIRLYHEADNMLPDWAGKLRSGIHLPRWASRLTLEVEAVRLEQLLAITHEDAKAEGVDGTKQGTYRKAFLDYFEKIHGVGSVENNPEVVVVTFKVHRDNIDTFKARRATNVQLRPRV